jgi:osmotically-inducible protein OsmY
MYLLDPEMGRTRRARLSDQVAALFRRGAREAARKTEYMSGQVEGLKHAVMNRNGGDTPATDETLVAKVESEVLSRWQYPKGDIKVNAVDGIIELRGQVESADQKDDLEQQVRKVTGVVDVHNYLHLPGEAPPNKEQAIRASRR